ncbi:6-phosphogluconate dehydrogenase, partial [Obelidium mucronatum]
REVYKGVGALAVPTSQNVESGLIILLQEWGRNGSSARCLLQNTSISNSKKKKNAMTFDDASLESTFEIVANTAAAVDANHQPQLQSDSKTLFITCSTVAPGLVEKLSHRHSDKITLLSAPVFGRPDAAANKQLVAVLAGGSDREKEIVAQYLEFTTRKITILNGPAHTANVLKLTGNFCIASVIDMLAQAQTLAQKNGVSRDAVVDIVSALMPGPIVSGYSLRIAANDFATGFTVEGGLKDVGLMKQLAVESGVSLPFADVVMDHLERQKEDDKDLDWASLAQVVRKDSGL